MKREFSFGGMSINENDQAMLISNYLTRDKIDELKEHFLKKKDNDGLPKDHISIFNTWTMMQELGFLINEQQKFDLLIKMGSRTIIDFKDVIKIYCQLIVIQEKEDNDEYDSDLIDAFSAVGGNEDGSGTVSGQKLLESLEEFGLSVDIKHLLKSIGISNDELNFKQFCKLIHGPEAELTGQDKGDENVR